MSMKEPSKEARELVNKWVYGIYTQLTKSEEHDLAARIDAHTAGLREQLSKQIIDDPENDGTDAAHPAWWRGNDRGSIGTAIRMREALNGSDDGSGVIGDSTIEQVRREILALREREEKIVAERDALHRTLRDALCKLEAVDHYRAHDSFRAQTEKMLSELNSLLKEGK